MLCLAGSKIYACGFPNSAAVSSEQLIPETKEQSIFETVEQSMVETIEQPTVKTIELSIVDTIELSIVDTKDLSIVETIELPNSVHFSDKSFRLLSIRFSTLSISLSDKDCMASSGIREFPVAAMIFIWIQHKNIQKYLERLEVLEKQTNYQWWVCAIIS
ncbi:hypothetical protein FF38_07127 [Lucilia cuprina]|uniref:Uncharacterized protein n=1 Tax=Lucilia cuprina TaxID=7375 RepID=A0A0L0CKE3_LUCCU|nr:hypothetical protein FF38_07127 [Lucilia cuprina]